MNGRATVLAAAWLFALAGTLDECAPASAPAEASALAAAAARLRPRRTGCAARPACRVRSGVRDGEVTVFPAPEADLAALAAFIAGRGGRLIPRGGTRLGLRIEADSALVSALAARPDVRFIDRARRLCVCNDYAAVDTAVAETREAFSLRGRGQVVTIADLGIDTGNERTMHPDFAKRLRAVVDHGLWTKGDYNGHGTHTAGTLAGSGAASGGRYAGVASESEMVVLTCGDTTGGSDIWFDDYALLLTNGVPYGSYVESDSWGAAGSQGVYDDLAWELDDLVFANPELLLVLAVGNDGPGRQTAQTPGTAKNALTVGNGLSSRTGSPAAMAKSSSRGPCADGRIKPDLVAPGSSIVSARSSVSRQPKWESTNAYYTVMSGTSMATPHVAGAAAVVRQWLMESRGFADAPGRRPTAALLKAVLTGGAVSSRADGAPDNDQGWGHLALEETVYPTNRVVRLFDRIPYEDGADWRVDFTSASDLPVDVQLCWIDAPGDYEMADGVPQLVNDLDLVVSNRQTGACLYGNGGPGGDRLNTVESVRFVPEAGGSYALIVRGVCVPVGRDRGGAAAVYLRGDVSVPGAEPTDEVRLAVTAEGPVVGACVPSPGVRAVARGTSVRLRTEGTAAFRTSAAFGPSEEPVARHAFLGWRQDGVLRTSETALAVAVSNDCTLAGCWRDTPEAVALFLRTRDAFGNLWLEGGGQGAEKRWVNCGASVTLTPSDAPIRKAYAGTDDAIVINGALQVADIGGASSSRAYGTLRFLEMSCTDEAGRGLYAWDAARSYRPLSAWTLAVTVPLAVDFGYADETAHWADSALPFWWYRRNLFGSLVSGELSPGAASDGGDPDGDGFPNVMEYAYGSDARDARSVPLLPAPGLFYLW